MDRGGSGSPGGPEHAGGENARWNVKASGRPTVAVLICTLNEAENLRYVLPEIPDWVDEILVVDGHSTDDTPQVVAAVCPRARLVVQPGRGKGDALHHGILEATADIVVTLDADGQTDPKEMSNFVEAILGGYDFAKGTRFRRPFSRSRPLHRILGNWLITLTFDVLFLKPFTDLCSGYNAFRREAIASVAMHSHDGLADEPLLNVRAVKAGLRIVEVPHRDLPRILGQSKAPTWRQGHVAIKTIVLERLRR